jgi:PBSX family phage portal protein
MKATIIKAASDKRQESNVKIVDKFDGFYDDFIIEPRYSFVYLLRLIEDSNILPQLIDIMSQNCDGFGHTFVETINDTEKTDRIKLVMQSEIEFLKNFFDYVCYEMSFTEVRKRLRADYESLGNGFLEALKNMKNVYDGFNHIPASDVRICKLSKPIDVKIKRRYPGSYDYVEADYKRRFRTFVQIVDLNEKIYFKEFGDPRKINAETGKEVTQDDIDKAEREGKEIIYATEMIWFCRYSSGSVYGLPRWIGCTVSVLGSRAVEEDNYDFFESSMSSKIIKVAGALSQKTFKRIKDFLSGSKGRGNRNKVLLLEAEIQKQVGAQKIGGTPEIEIVDMKQRDEASHLKYDKENRKKIRSSFRLPPLYTGETEDYTLATAKASKEVAEQQVFGPEKDAFDFFINQFILPELNIKYYKFESKSAPLEDRTEQAQLIKTLGDIGLTVGEVRKLSDKLADVELDEIDPEVEGNEWMNVPMKIAQYVMALSTRQASMSPNAKDNKSSSVDKFVEGLELLAKQLRDRRGL